MKFTLLLLLVSVEAFATAKPPPQVMVHEAQLKKVSKTLLFPGLIKSRVESNIKADEDLIVIRPFVTLGQKVAKGEKLLELKNQNTSVNYRNKVLYAPVSGTVAAILVDQGQFVQKGEALIKLNDPSQLYVKLEAPMSNFKDLKTGLKAQVKSSSSSEIKYNASVSGVGAVVDSLTGTVPVELTLGMDQSHSLLPGTITTVELFLLEEDKLLVPESAIYYSGEKTFLAVLKSGKVQKLPVKLGQRLKGDIEVLEGVKLGEVMITGSGEFLKEGMDVEVTKN